MRPTGLCLLALLLAAPLAGASGHLPPVENVRVTSENQRLVIEWDPVDDAAVTGYYVYVYFGGRLVQQVNATTSPAAFRGTNDRSYAVEVAARDAAGTAGPVSAPAAGTPTLKEDQTYLALGLIVVWVGVWLYAVLLTRLERSLVRQLDRIQREKERLGEQR